MRPPEYLPNRRPETGGFENARTGTPILSGGDDVEILPGQSPPGRAGVWLDRDTIELGLNEQCTGVICLRAQAAYCGNRLWEEKHPDVAQALRALAESHCQQDPTFRTALSDTRLTVAAALDRLRAQGFPEDGLPSPSTMAQVLNRNGYRLRKVVKAKPQKNSRKRMPSLPISRTRTESP